MKCRLFKKRLLVLSLLPLPLAGAYAMADGDGALSPSMSQKETVLASLAGVEDEDSPVKRILQGTIVDANDGTPLIGATVMVKGTQNGVSTDINGNFSISISGATNVLEISYVGYKSQEVYITDQGVVNVKLIPDNEMLGEVVVVGAGTQKKVSVTGAITAVEGASLRVPSSSLTNNLAGQLAGVISVSGTGEPGSSSAFYIRGISTFGGRATPLILLDGVEISTGDLNNIPAETIESFSILKDASATAIYGTRGANGVMLITTKSGEENTKAKINVTYEHSFGKPANMVEYADGVTYMNVYNEALSQRKTTGVAYTDDKITNTASGINPYVFPNVDWQDMLFRDMTQNQRANINISGGGSRVTYYVSVQANHDNGVLDVPQYYSFSNNYNRWMYTFQNNIDYKVTPTTTLGLRMNAQITNVKSPNNSASDIFRQIYYNNPVAFPAYFPQGESSHILFGTDYRQGTDLANNPYAYMLNTFKSDNQNMMHVTLNLDQKLDFITEGLSLTALVNFKNWSENYYTRSIAPYYYRVANGSWGGVDDAAYYELEQLKEGEEYINESGITKNGDQTFYFDSRLNYNRTFGSHNVTGMLMYMMREFRNSVLPERNQSFSGRFTYDYDHKYLAEFNFGYNGTERLAAGSRYEFFPAGSIGWVVSSEDFWEPLSKYVNHFKVRASYGLVGSDDTGEDAGAPHFLYKYDIDLTGGWGFTSGQSGNNSQYYTGLRIKDYPVANATWERSKQFDVGVDLQLFNDLNLTFDYFYYKRDRILLNRGSFPRILGYEVATPWANVGRVDNKGIELSANWHKQLTRDLYIDFRGNFTYSQNKYVYKDEPDYPYVWRTETGKPLNAIRGYIAEGLFEDWDDINSHAVQDLGSDVMPGDIKYRDVNGDGVINVDDQVVLSDYGNTPQIQYGFGVSLVWKKLDMNVFFSGSAKRAIMLTDNQFYPFVRTADYLNTNLMQWIADSHWTEGGNNANVAYPRMGITTADFQNNMQSSSWWLRNGSFLRFKTLEIGYRPVSFCRVYFSGDNLAVWSPFKYWDPELRYYDYPMNRTFNVGVQLNF